MTTTTEQAFRDHLATAEASMPAEAREDLELVCYGEGYALLRPEKPVDYTTKTFLLDGQVYEWIPCESWTCQRPHTVLPTGPTLASFHRVESEP